MTSHATRGHMLMLGLAAVATAAAMGACSSRNDPAELLLPYYYRQVGLPHVSDVSDRVVKHLTSEGFDVLTRQEEPGMYVRTGWKRRSPLDQERDKGVDLAQTRLLIEGVRPSAGSPEGYVLHVRVENQLRFANGVWEERPITSDFRDFAAKLIGGIERQFRSRLRLFW